jgi:hypothetical protein
MFLVHLIFFHGAKAHHLDGAVSIEDPKQAVLQNRH